MFKHFTVSTRYLKQTQAFLIESRDIDISREYAGQVLIIISQIR